jgi:hypothetical protein
VLNEPATPPTTDDTNQLYRIKHYRSLMPMAMEARKPMFLLTPANGAVGAHQTNVRQCFRDFESLAKEIANRASVVRGEGGTPS